jgi:hypothetical protein
MDKGITKFYTQIKRLKGHFEELEALKGDKFNVFKLLNLQEKEELFHTPYISNLLNSKGSHNQGAIFLDSFIKILNSELNLEISVTLSSAMVFPEKYIGKISSDGENGGKIDILITDRANTIIIENKIYAKDQKKQLIRYHNYSRDNQTLLYLNLFGTAPSGISTGNRLKEGLDFFIISYKKHIIKWLNHCKQIAIDLPIIRESISQYINTIKELCGVSSNLKFERNMEK